jgi:hypothetical protein
MCLSVCEAGRDLPILRMLGGVGVRKILFCETWNRLKFRFIPSEFCLFGEMENAWNSVPSQSLAVKKLGILFQNHLIAKNSLNFEISVPYTIPQKIKMPRTISQKRKTFRILFRTIERKKNFWKLVPNHLRMYRPHTVMLNRPLSSAATMEVQGPDTT